MILLEQQLLAQQPGPPPFDALSMALGVAAVLLVLGWSITRWQRDRERFALMQKALEKGVTRFPGTPPYWLVSLRQGVTLTAVGIGLIGAGGGAFLLAHGVPMATPPASVPSAVTEPSRSDSDSERLPPQGAPPFDREHGPPPRGGGPWDAGPPDSHPPHGQSPDQMRPEHVRPEHLLQDQQHERWHRAQAQQTIGLVSVATGLILLLVGVVRIGFAKVEQRYATESDDTAGF
jgi:hypothetical protein